MARPRPLAGTRVAITRPAGTGTTLARRVSALGGTPLLLPGSSLREAPGGAAAGLALKAALACDATIFTSPAAVRFARGLGARGGRGQVLAPGAGTLRALRRAGFTDAAAPTREDSEGLLAMPALRDVAGRRVGIVGAPGGRGLLDRDLATRGAQVIHAFVYLRVPARLDQRHTGALRHAAAGPLYVLLSSAEALANLLAGLPEPARRSLLAGTATVSSLRLAGVARRAAFARVLQAASPHAVALLDAVIADRAGVALPATMAARS